MSDYLLLLTICLLGSFAMSTGIFRRFGDTTFRNVDKYLPIGTACDTKRLES
jgi:hypothetical protein